MATWWQRTKRAAGRAARSAGSSVGTAVGAVAGGIAGAPLGPAGIAAGAALGAKAGEYVGGVGGRVVGRGLESAPTPKGGAPVAPLIPSSAVSYADGATLTLDASGGGKLRGRFGTVAGFVGADGVWRSASVARAAYTPGGVVATGASYKGTIGGKVFGAPVAGVEALRRPRAQRSRSSPRPCAESPPPRPSRASPARRPPPRPQSRPPGST
jgi:hypothetical protein